LLYAPGKAAPVLFASAIPLTPKSTVGCGDAALAGFAFALSSGSSPEDSLRTAVACAAANCVADSPGAAEKSVIEKFRTQVRVETFIPGP
jgi:1-phosphofructokinase